MLLGVLSLRYSSSGTVILWFILWLKDTLSGFWSPKQCQAQVPSHGTSLKITVYDLHSSVGFGGLRRKVTKVPREV